MPSNTPLTYAKCNPYHILRTLPKQGSQPPVNCTLYHRKCSEFAELATKNLRELGVEEQSMIADERGNC